jgi:hypothetical protein
LAKLAEIRLRRAHQKAAVIVASGYTDLLVIFERLDQEVERLDRHADAISRARKIARMSGSASM